MGQIMQRLYQPPLTNIYFDLNYIREKLEEWLPNHTLNEEDQSIRYKINSQLYKIFFKRSFRQIRDHFIDPSLFEVFIFLGNIDDEDELNQIKTSLNELNNLRDGKVLVAVILLIEENENIQKNLILFLESIRESNIDSSLQYKIVRTKSDKIQTILEQELIWASNTIKQKQEKFSNYCCKRKIKNL